MMADTIFFIVDGDAHPDTLAGFFETRAEVDAYLADRWGRSEQDYRRYLSCCSKRLAELYQQGRATGEDFRRHKEVATPEDWHLNDPPLSVIEMQRHRPLS